MAGLATLFASDRFYVNAAEITGVTYSARDEIYRRAGVHDYSVFWIDEEAVADRLRAMPFVRSARIRTSLPHTVRIEIVEREPAAIWHGSGRDLWVDSEGITLPVASQLTALPILVDMDGSSVTASGRVDPRIIGGVVALDQQLPNINRFAYDRTRGLHFTMPNGTLVVLGENERLPERVQQLIQLQSALDAQGKSASEIDLSHDDGYYMKLAP
jgi:cell division protein FtsQ